MARLFLTEVTRLLVATLLHTPFQDASGTNTSEEYDKVTHEDVQSMNSPSEQPAESVGPDVDNAEEGEAHAMLFVFYARFAGLCVSLQRLKSGVFRGDF